MGTVLPFGRRVICLLCAQPFFDRFSEYGAPYVCQPCMDEGIEAQMEETARAAGFASWDDYYAHEMCAQEAREPKELLDGRGVA